MKNLFRLLFLSSLFIPTLASASCAVEGPCGGGATTTLNTSAAVMLFFGVLFALVILWGIVRTVVSKGDPQKVLKSQRLIIYGLIGVLIILGVWGYQGGPLNMPLFYHQLWVT